MKVFVAFLLILVLAGVVVLCRRRTHACQPLRFRDRIVGAPQAKVL